jgi:perosamine synthetase
MADIRQVPFGRPWITDEDREAVLEVLNGPILTHGPQCKAFEAEFAAFVGSGAFAVSVSSCMAALHLAYLHCGVGSGDEVIVPAQTHVATAHAVEWTGATPVFVDCDPATGNVTADAIAAAIGPRTKAIAVVHFVGIPCEMPGIVAVARHHGLKVIEDCALALGARYDATHVGLFGDAGCFSFYPVKHITSAEGGMCVTRDEATAQAVARLRAFGVDRTYAERTLPGMYDVPTLGLNYRMSELQAALGRSQLRRADEILARRRRNFERLSARVGSVRGVRLLDVADSRAASGHYCLTVALDGALALRRDEIVRRLNAAGVGTSVHYPQPVPRMTFYRNKYGYDPARYRGAEAISDASFALPVAPHVTPEDVDYMATAVCAAIDARDQAHAGVHP